MYIIQRIKDMIGWGIFFAAIAAWLIYNRISEYFFIDIGDDFSMYNRANPKPKWKKIDPDKYNVDYFKRLQKEKVVDKVETGGWELLLSNSNHYKNVPHCIIKTSSLELATYLLNTLSEAFKDNGYKSFSLYIKSTNGGVIVKEKSDAV
jgi:hypothetical protein